MIELNTGESPGYGMLSPRDKPIVINVKGPSELRSSAVENLRVQIDGVPYPLPASVTGAMFVSLPDAATAPPAPKASPAASGQTAKAVAPKTKPKAR